VTQRGARRCNLTLVEPSGAPPPPSTGAVPFFTTNYCSGTIVAWKFHETFLVVEGGHFSGNEASCVACVPRR
jgi:hypothetical protein